MVVGRSDMLNVLRLDIIIPHSRESNPGDGGQGCKMAKFDPLLSLDCARVEGVGAQSKERKGSNFAA